MSSYALKILRLARSLLAARPMKEDKLLALMAKIRKGAGTYKGAELRQVLDYLGGWSIREITILEPMGKSKDYMRQEDRPVIYSSENKANVEATRESFKTNEVTKLPDVSTLELNDTVYMDIGPITESDAPWAKDKDGNPVKVYGFHYRGWRVVSGTEITSPEGNVWSSAMSLRTFDNEYPSLSGVLRWLKTDTNFLQQVSDKLGLPTLEAEKAEKARQKKIPTKENTGTCPCCFGVYKLVPKTRYGLDKSMPGMTLHGYKRPGTGTIYANCFGEFWPPFELSKEGTEAFLERVKEAQRNTQSALDRLNRGDTTVLMGPKDKFIKKSEVPEQEWDKLVQSYQEKYKSELEILQHTEKTLNDAIKDWVKKDLPGRTAKTAEESKAAVEKPSQRDQQDAIDHASDFTTIPLSLKDFDLEYLGMLRVQDLYEFDDLASWLDFSPGSYDGVAVEERLGELESFRGSSWAKRARTWIQNGIPPIIVITVPDDSGVMSTMIGDGRGRVNVAALMDLQIPVWSMTYRVDKTAAGFNFNEFRHLAQSGNEDGSDMESRIQTANWYARQNLKKLGAGAARNVYALSPTTVLKIAQDPRGGTQQNLIEATLSQWGERKSPIAVVHDQDPDGVWIVADRVTPLHGEDDLVRLVGFDSADLRSQLGEMLGGTPRRADYDDLLWGLYELVKVGDLELRDVVSPSHWGQDAHGKPVLFDYGLLRD